MSSKRIYLYPAWIRLWHLFNAICFLILVITGLSMHFGTAEGKNLIRFDLSVSLHNVAAIILTAGYAFYVTGNLVTKNGRYYGQWRKNMGPNLLKQARFYAFGIFRGEPHPFPVTEEQKFNPLQKFAYVLAMYVGMPLLIISGFGLLFPETIAYTVFGVSGLVLTDLLHIIMGFVLTLFLVIHLYTCTLGEKPGTLFKGIIKGYHEGHE
jgi:thiosulfate reductase cytochrome b subunit